jgi:transglutaminase-like putative cysteine protease
VLLAVVGLAAVELVVDLVAVTLRRAAAAGLPLLAVFALCTSVSKGGVGWLAFGIGTSGYLWLLLADSRERISRWGRTLGVEAGRPRINWADTETAPSPLSALGRRIGATAIAVGVVVPMLIPGLHGGLPKHGGNGDGPGRGSSQVVTLNPIVNIRAQLTSPKAIPVLRMTSTDPSPTYLRLTSLDRFDGTTFSPSNLVAGVGARVSKGIHGPAVTGTAEQTKVSVDNFSVHWLPLPTQVESVDVKGDWRYDPGSNTVFSAKSDTKKISYTVVSTRFEPTASQLSQSGFVVRGDVPAAYLDLPPVSPGVATLAQTVTAKAKSAFGKAVAIQSYLTGPSFLYDTSVPASDSMDALAQFLLVTKRGFCQQYAASMAVLARLVGIPSRVAVGFTHGDRQSDGTWLVTTHDAHAWPELYFPGFGWLPFEPTPRGDGQAIAPTFTRTDNGSFTDVGPTPNAQPSNEPALSPADRKQLERETPTPPPARHRPTAPGGPSLWWLVAVPALLLPVPGLVRAGQRRRRWSLGRDGARAAHAGWAELRASAIDAGVGWVDGISPRAAARVVAADTALDAPTAAALRRVVQAEERARYAAAPAGADTAELRADVTSVARAMTADRPLAQRLAVVAWPRSTMRTARGLLTAVADGLNILDTAGARLRAAVQLPRWSS